MLSSTGFQWSIPSWSHGLSFRYFFFPSEPEMLNQKVMGSCNSAVPKLLAIERVPSLRPSKLVCSAAWLSPAPSRSSGLNYQYQQHSLMRTTHGFWAPTRFCLFFFLGPPTNRSMDMIQVLKRCNSVYQKLRWKLHLEVDGFIHEVSYEWFLPQWLLGVWMCVCARVCVCVRVCACVGASDWGPNVLK